MPIWQHVYIHVFGAPGEKLVREVTLNIFVEKTLSFSPTAKRKVIFKQILDLKLISLM